LLLETLVQASGGQDLPFADLTGDFVQSDEAPRKGRALPRSENPVGGRSGSANRRLDHETTVVPA